MPKPNCRACKLASCQLAPVNERTDRRSPLVIVHSSTQQRPVGDQHGVCDPPRAHAPSSAGRAGREVVGGQAIDGKVDWKTTPPSSPAAIDDETARRGSPCDLRSTTYYDRGRENPFDPQSSRLEKFREKTNCVSVRSSRSRRLGPSTKERRLLSLSSTRA